jgi:twitching motility protein PilT
MSIIDILRKASKIGASDIHLIEGSPVIYRVEGELIKDGSNNLTEDTLKEYACFLLEESGILNNPKEKDNIKELDFSFAIDNLNRFRVNIFKQRGYYSISIRVIPNMIPKWSTLGLPESVKDFANLKKGLVIVTGPTGSGKSTTLASLINIINEERNCHIITLEDPIEFLHDSKNSIINQREINKDTDSFKNGLRGAMREDPDVILVGEMRDFDTIQTTITAAETGHLVFATLHTVNAAKAIDRIIDVFPSEQQNQIRVQLSETLKGVIAQQLIPTVEKKRTVAVEILKVNTAVRNLIRQGKTYQIKSIIETGSRDGMMTMTQSLYKLQNEGLISEENMHEYSLSE